MPHAKMDQKMGSFASAQGIVKTLCRFYILFFASVEIQDGNQYARINIHVTVFQVSILNMCLLYILKIVKIQKLEKIYQ